MIPMEHIVVSDGDGGEHHEDKYDDDEYEHEYDDGYEHEYDDEYEHDDGYDYGE